MDILFALNDISIIKKKSILQRIVQGTPVQSRLTVRALAHIIDYVNGFKGSELIYELPFIYIYTLRVEFVSFYWFLYNLTIDQKKFAYHLKLVTIVNFFVSLKLMIFFFSYSIIG